MRAMYCDGSSARLREDLPRPEPASGAEARLRVRFAGICDTDLQLARGYMGFRGILGHEFVAEDESGRRVTAEINQPCWGCATCAAGRPGHCPSRTVLGISGRDGAMAEEVWVDPRTIHAIPDGVGDEEAVFVEPLAAAYRVSEQVELGGGTRVAVLGDGKLGALCAWVARAEGARVCWIGKHPEKLAIAGEGIETLTTDGAAGRRKGFDVVIEATGSTGGLEAATELARPTGTVVLKTTVAEPHRLSLAPVVIDELRVLGSRCGPFPRAIEALASGAVDVRPLIEAVYPLSSGEEAFARAARRGARKILLRIGGGG